ncbi:MAG: acetolactate synthase [Eubacterium sp.]|nr:acetolactate synthase [Eubacterium sp.]
MAVKQISVFLENKKGNLAEFANVLSNGNINLRALSLADAGDFGLARMIVDDVYKASTALKEAKYISKVKEVLAIEISDEPGSLSKVLAELGSNDVNVDYMYAFTNHTPGKANMILRVSDNRKATEILSKTGVRQLTQDDLANM